MTSRHHYFSHIENLNTGSLVLTNPFEEGHDQGLVCRYELHRIGAAALDPDPEEEGVAAWRKLLPVTREHPIANQPVMQITSSPSPLVDSLSVIRYNRALPFLAAAPAALDAGMSTAFCAASQPVPDAWEGLEIKTSGPPFEQGLSHGAAALREAYPEAADFSPWGNPFRLEGLKLIGFEIMRRYGESRPTLVVHDPTGELIMALELASQPYRMFYGTPPFRTILVQERPLTLLCSAFEGLSPDWSPLDDPANQIALRPPDPFVGEIVQHITTHMGTAVAVDPGDVFEQALDRLARTGFVDDEDQVVMISPDLTVQV